MFNRKKRMIEELEEALEESIKRKDHYYDRTVEEMKRRVELEEKNKELEKRYGFVCRARDYWSKVFHEEADKVHDLEDKVTELKDRLKNVELELEQTKKSSDHWYNQFEHVSGECNAYAAISKKFMAVHEDGDIDDTHIIHNGKVYTIIGIKHIVDNLGDTLDIRAELIDPEKEEEKKIGFKVEEKKEDK